MLTVLYPVGIRRYHSCFPEENGKFPLKNEFLRNDVSGGDKKIPFAGEITDFTI